MGCISGVELSLGLWLHLSLSLTEGTWLEHLSLEVLLEPSIELQCEGARSLLIVSLILLESSE